MPSTQRLLVNITLLPCNACCDSCLSGLLTLECTAKAIHTHTRARCTLYCSICTVGACGADPARHAERPNQQPLGVRPMHVWGQSPRPLFLLDMRGGPAVEERGLSLSLCLCVYVCVSVYLCVCVSVYLGNHRCVMRQLLVGLHPQLCLCGDAPGRALRSFEEGGLRRQ
jgi:hypothetical protein